MAEPTARPPPMGAPQETTGGVHAEPGPRLSVAPRGELRRVIVIDDDDEVLKSITRLLRAHNVVTVSTTDPQKALELAREGTWDVMLTDQVMPRMNGMELLRRVRTEGLAVEVVMMTAHGGDQMATQAVDEGAFGFLRKPVADADLSVTVARAADSKRMRLTLGDYDNLGTLVGRSPAMRKLFQAVRVMAGVDLSVLLLGESGTGKTEVARRIHEGSRRSAMPFVELNCASFTEHLAESELFGHEKGAFTGATETKAGKIAAANGGTLFLDEIGDMSLSVQARLLKFLQSQRYHRLGGTQEIDANVRVVAATHKDLASEIRKGTFREDLYFRLAMEKLSVPALRERPEDIHPLAMHFLQKHPRPRGGVVAHLAPEALVALTSNPWPGNVRELENTIRRGVAWTAGDTLTLEALPEELQRREAPLAVAVPDRLRFPEGLLAKPFQEAKDAVLEAFERSYLRALLQRSENKSQAATQAGMDRNNFNRLVRRVRPNDASEP